MRFVLTLSLLALSPLAHAGYDKHIPPNYVENLLRSSPEAYFEEMNSGWRSELYSGLKAKMSPGRSYVVLHNRLPSTTLDLRSGNGFRSSVMAVGLLNMQQMDIGHVMLGWHCEIDGQIFEGNTSITGEQGDQQKKMAADGWGLTGLFSIFKDGHLQTPALQASVFRTHLKSQFATTAFEVEPEQCGKLLTYLQDFLKAPNEPMRRFGLNADPLKLEGGGCGSFAAAAVSTTGAIDDIFPHFWRRLHVNPKTLGYGLPSLPSEIEVFSFRKNYGPSHKVNQLKALFALNWNGDERDPSTHLMDPEMLFLFQRTANRMALDDVYRDSLAMGRKLLASPYSKARILKEGGGLETKVDESYDRLAANVVHNTKRWFRAMKAKGAKAKGFLFAGQPAVLITR